MLSSTRSPHATRLSKSLAMVFLAALLAAPAFSQQDIEQRKIEYLISSIAELHDARFIRNGSAYDPQRAADHLRLKLRYSSGRVKTAEDFIVYCATGSSMTGGVYQIKFADGHVVATAAFLRNKLAVFSAHGENTPQKSSGE